MDLPQYGYTALCHHGEADWRVLTFGLPGEPCHNALLGLWRQHLFQSTAAWASLASPGMSLLPKFLTLSSPATTMTPGSKTPCMLNA